MGRNHDFKQRAQAKATTGGTKGRSLVMMSLYAAFSLMAVGAIVPVATALGASNVLIVIAVGVVIFAAAVVLAIRGYGHYRTFRGGDVGPRDPQLANDFNEIIKHLDD